VQPYSARRGPGGGGSAPRPAHGGCKTGGAHSKFLACRREDVLGVFGGLGCGHPRPAITLGPARAFPVPRIMVWRIRQRAMPSLVQVSASSCRNRQIFRNSQSKRQKPQFNRQRLISVRNQRGRCLRRRIASFFSSRRSLAGLLRHQSRTPLNAMDRSR
jgi:hypothetical protein